MLHLLSLQSSTSEEEGVAEAKYRREGEKDNGALKNVTARGRKYEQYVKFEIERHFHLLESQGLYVACKAILYFNF